MIKRCRVGIVKLYKYFYTSSSPQKEWSESDIFIMSQKYDSLTNNTEYSFPPMVHFLFWWCRPEEKEKEPLF